jgi:hypothetical protein
MPRVMLRPTPARRRLLTPLALATAALGLAGCGEKDEPEVTGPEPVAQQPAGFDIIGTWKGTLRQKGLKPFRVTATIRSLENERRNSVAYTGIDCAGGWTFQGLEGDTYRFREVIDRGRGGNCKGVGTVTLTPTPADRLDYTFTGGGVESRGVLSRAG